MVTVKEIGVYQHDWNSHQYLKTDFNYITENRELWLVGINPISSKMIGNSNYSTDHEVKAHYIFRINSGLNKGKSYLANEDYLVVFEVCIDDWYRPEETILSELREALLDKYPIINCQLALDACKVRGIYSGYYKEKIII
jgi:hypothetical protein